MTNNCIAGAFTLAILISVSCGCANVPSGAGSSTQTQSETSAVNNSPADTASSEPGLSGVWQGESVSTSIDDPSDPGRISAMQRITLTMFQQGETITGFYHCAFGNQVCRHMNETGVIRNGRIKYNRLSMRVMLEDGSMCFFTGVPQGEQFNGGYECLQGGGIIEQGYFQTLRTY